MSACLWISELGPGIRHRAWRVEWFPRLDVSMLARAGCLTSGEHVLVLPDGDSVEVTAIGESVVIRWQGALAELELTRTPCNFGGHRWWFLCPELGCGRRTGSVFLTGLAIRCRVCAGLRYSSQLETPSQRDVRKAIKNRVRCGGRATIAEPFPPRPPHMQYRTYMRLRDEARRLERAFAADLTGSARLSLDRWRGLL